MNTVLTYEGYPITFENKDGKMMVNATQMAKKFDKRPGKWLEMESTQRFLETLSCIRQTDTCDFQAVTTIMGSPEHGGGTWFHEDVAIEFARWLSPEFAIWCNDHIKELLKTGSTSIAREETLLDKQMKFMEFTSRFLSLNENSKLLMSQAINEQHNLNIPLPSYTASKDVLFSATALLKRIGSPMQAVAFNKKLEEHGYLVQMTRQSSKGEKKFWSLTDKGMEFGENQVCPKNPKETQPSYYETKFKTLYDLCVA